MSTQFFKATRPDGTDFRTGRIDYAAALGGDPIALPTVGYPQCCTGDVLHASTVAAETLIGGGWQCRLFLVEGEPVAEEGHKRGFFSLRVVEEIDSHHALGPNGAEVARVIEKARNLTEDQANAINTTWDATRSAAGGATGDAAEDASRHSAWAAAGSAAWAAAGSAAGSDAGSVAWAASWAASCSAARAAVVRDLISDKHYQTLAGPWESVMGPIFEDKEQEA